MLTVRAHILADFFYLFSSFLVRKNKKRKEKRILSISSNRETEKLKPS
jgi:hypothetical protein